MQWHRWLHIMAVTLLGLGAAYAGWWFLSGGRIYSVPTGSMQPVFKAGDAVLTVPINQHKLAVGTIVTYRDSKHPDLLLTHRIVALQPQTAMLTTKGDHNPEPDLPINQRQIIAQAVWVAPHLGQVLSWLRRPVGLAVAVYLPALVTLLVGCKAIFGGNYYSVAPRHRLH